MAPLGHDVAAVVGVRSSRSRPIHVLHVIAGLDVGGAETALVRLIRYSAGAGLRHTVFTLKPGGELLKEFEESGAVVLAPPDGSRWTILANIIGLRRRLGSDRPDVVQGWMVHGNLVAWFLRAIGFRRARLAWNLRMTLNDTLHEKGRTIGLTRRAAMLSKSVDLLIANSDTSMREHAAAGYRPRRSLVIPNGFDPSIFAPDPVDRARLRATWKVPDQALVFGLVGRFHRTKGHELFAHAAVDILRRHPRTRFVLAGAATDASPALDRLLADVGVGDAFVRLGARRDISSIMQALDVVCVPSYYESFPNVLGEAMMSGRPVIATDVSDVATIMGRIGQIIPVGDAGALAAAMQAMIDVGTEGRSAIGQAGRTRMIEQYSLDHIVDLYAEQYRQLSDRSIG